MEVLKISKNIIQILIIDDNPDDRFLIKRELEMKLSNINVIEINNIDLFQKYNNEKKFDIVITDYQLKWSNGIFILMEIKNKHPNRPVVMYTATGSEEVAVEAMKLGLEDYILKSNMHISKLSMTVKRIIDKIHNSKKLKFAQIQLHESEEKYKTIITSLRDGVIIVNHYGVIKEINKSALELFGYSKNELINENLSILLDYSSSKNKNNNLLDFKKSILDPLNGNRAEVKGFGKNNQSIDISISFSDILLYNEIYYVAVIHDIRIRKSAERKIILQSNSIQRINRLLNCIIASNDIFKYATEEKLVLQDICNLLTSIGGYQVVWIGYAYNNSDEKFRIEAINTTIDSDIVLKSIGKSKNEIYSDKLVKTVLEKGEMILQRDMNIDIFDSNKNNTKDLSLKFSSMLLPIKYNNQVIGVLSVNTTAENVFNKQEIKFLKDLTSILSFGIKTIRNQTEIERIQSKLNKQKIEMLKLLKAVDQSPSIVIITDTDSKIEYVNPKFCEVTGYELKEIIGKSTNILKSKHTSPLIYKELYKTIKNKKEWRGILKNKKKNGDYFWVSNSISSIVDSSGKIVNYLSVQKDITDEKKIEEQLRQSQKMEAIGRLAGGISHDYKNILTGISLCADYMETELPKDSPLRAEVIEIKKSVKLANFITKQLLDFSKKDHIELETFNVLEVINDTYLMLKRLLGKNYKLNIFQPQVKLAINGNPTQLEQIILNLVLNAKDAMPKGGLIDIIIQEVLIDDNFNITNLQNESLENEFHKLVFPKMNNQINYLLIQVKDNGIGIQDNELPYVFEPFYTTKEPGKGTGLGLSTVYGIIRDWNGNISVNSQLNKGTIFNILIPLVKTIKIENMK